MQTKLLSKPKLLYIITKSNWGGAQKYIFDLATSAIKNDFDIYVMVGGNGELIERLEQENVKVIRSKFLKNSLSPYHAIKMFFEIYKVVGSEDFKIVHINSSIASVLGSIVCRILNVKTIFTTHGWPFNENRPRIVKIIFRYLMLLTVYISNRTIAVSQNIASGLRAPNFIQNKIELIYLGAEKIKSKNLPKLSTGSSITHIVSVGELNRNKNHISFIKIMRHIKGIHYHIIGQNSGELAKIEELIKINKLEKKVTIYGHIKSVSSIMSQFDMFLLPSHTEALGYVVIEALQQGLPVIARKVGGVPEIINNLPHSTLYEKDSELIEIIPRYIEVNKKLNSISVDDDKQVFWHNEKFSKENMIEKTKAIYLDLLKK